MCEKGAYLQNTILFYVLHSKHNTDTLSENNSVRKNEQTICSHCQTFTAIVQQTNNNYHRLYIYIRCLAWYTNAHVTLPTELLIMLVVPIPKERV